MIDSRAVLVKALMAFSIMVASDGPLGYPLVSAQKARELLVVYFAVFLEAEDGVLDEHAG